MVIALIGIVNTLMLSVFERTHEIGLLRAVGMKRRQVRVMIRSESVILAVFGAIIGIVVGTALGAAFSASLKQQGITDVVIPGSSLVIFLVLSVVLGLGAASWPARRAGKIGRPESDRHRLTRHRLTGSARGVPRGVVQSSVNPRPRAASAGGRPAQ